MKLTLRIETDADTHEVDWEDVEPSDIRGVRKFLDTGSFEALTNSGLDWIGQVAWKFEQLEG